MTTIYDTLPCDVEPGEAEDRWVRNFERLAPEFRQAHLSLIARIEAKDTAGIPQGLQDSGRPSRRTGGAGGGG